MEEECKACNGTKRITKSWSAGGGRFGYQQWLEDCPDCGPFAVAMKELEIRLEIYKEIEKGIDIEFEALGELLK